MTAADMRDVQLGRVLEELGIPAGALIARGGEASVYRCDADHVARIAHAGESSDVQLQRVKLLGELAATKERLGFEIPTVLSQMTIHGRVVTIEPYFVGQTLESRMAGAAGHERERLAVVALEAAHAFRLLDWQGRDFRDLYWDPPTCAGTWKEYLERRAGRSLARAGAAFEGVDPVALAAQFEGSPVPGFLHFDCYLQNILVDDGRVSAIVDFGGMCMSGDPRFEPLTAAIYLGAGRRDDDRFGVGPVCREWLAGAEIWCAAAG